MAVVAFAACAWAASPAAASHTGGSYTGPTSNGGTIELMVSADQTEVTSFLYLLGTAVPGTLPDGSSCETANWSVYGGHPKPVIDHAFEYPKTEPEPGFYAPVLTHLVGTFPMEGSASGTLQIFDRRFGPECTSTVITWTAAIPGFNDAACTRAEANVTRAKRRLQNAEGAAEKRRAKRKLERAKAEREEACG